MRGLVERENELRLDILESLAKSQRALASIIGNMADVSGGSKEHAEGLLKHIQTLVQVQEVLAGRILGIKLRRVVKGKPGPVWLAGRVVRGRLPGDEGGGG